MRFTLITQLVLITISLVIAFAFLKPSFVEIKEKQDELFLYKDTVAKAEEYNRAIQSLIERKNSFSDSDVQNLDTFIPTEIDSLKVMRDIESMFAFVKIPLLTLTPKELVNPQSADVIVESQIVAPQPVSTNTTYQDFEVTFIGTYEELKEVLSLSEKNETLLELVSLVFEPYNPALEDAELDAKDTVGAFKYLVVFRTYGLAG
jgi:hypothetical protein